MTFDEHALSYDQDLRRGLRWAGEGPEWFARRRVEIVRDHMQHAAASVKRVLEFGCGVGNHIPSLRACFPGCRIVGVDISTESLNIAASRHFGPDLRLCPPEDFRENHSLDLVYVNGVFHHIPSSDHVRWIRYFQRVLKPGGTLAIFDNNPFSLPARLVMKCIPFDRDAVLVNPYRFARLVSHNGFVVPRPRFYFVFPRSLQFLRGFEANLVGLPLGAQYCLIAQARHTEE